MWKRIHTDTRKEAVADEKAWRLREEKAHALALANAKAEIKVAMEKELEVERAARAEVERILRAALDLSTTRAPLMETLEIRTPEHRWKRHRIFIYFYRRSCSQIFKIVCTSSKCYTFYFS